MANPSDLDRQYFEKALDEHQQAAKAFARNVRIVSVLLVAFQFIIFFRFVDLDDRQHNLDQRLAQLNAERTALVAVGGHIRELAATLDPLSVRLLETPDALHEQIRVLDDYIRRLREEPAADGSQPLNPRQAPLVDTELPPDAQRSQQQQQQSQQQVSQGVQLEAAQQEVAAQEGVAAQEDVAAQEGVAAQEEVAEQVVQQGVTQQQQQQQQQTPLATETGSLLVYLDAPEQQDVRAILASGEPAVAFDALITDIINDHIVPAIFAGLNAYKNEAVVPAFQRERDELFRALDEGTLTQGEENPGTPIASLGGSAPTLELVAPAWADDVKTAVSDVETRLEELELTPPLGEEWVREYSAKLVVFDQLEALVGEYRSGLGQQELAIHELQTSLTQQLAQGTFESGEIAGEIALLEAEYARVREQLGAYPDVLPVIPLELKYAVLLFPALLAVIVAYFAVRYAGLRQQAATLLALAPAFQLSQPVSRLYLGDRILAWRLPTRHVHRRYLRAAPILAAVLLVPVVLAAVSYLRVILSGGLRDELTWWLVSLYAVTGVVLIAACVALPAPSAATLTSATEPDPTSRAGTEQEHRAP